MPAAVFYYWERKCEKIFIAVKFVVRKEGKCRREAENEGESNKGAITRGGKIADLAKGAAVRR